ncbi:MAG: response regulator [Bacteroidales bacterium]|nr:response regulator [Bacteroidales bacterium]
MMDKKITILYVDDEPINLSLFQYNLKKKFDVLTAESGAEGLEILKENPHIRIVISDMKMPGMSGIDFIKLAKKDYPDIQYFILTGFDITEEIADALNERLIHKYFRKPFNMKEIEASLFEIL